jgi:hypothetical protein
MSALSGSLLSGWCVAVAPSILVIGLLAFAERPIRLSNTAHDNKRRAHFQTSRQEKIDQITQRQKPERFERTTFFPVARLLLAREL